MGRLMRSSVRVWDGPTRLFHWLLVVLFAFSWWSAENREMEWHVLSGLSLLGLLIFRLLWGVLGGSTARFTGFVKPPSAILAYLGGRVHGRVSPGHNPLGGYSVIAMLLVLALQTTTGLFATDVDGLDSGPLSFLVTFEQGRIAAQVHEIAFNVSLALIALHVLAIAFYLVVRRRNLITPMVTGKDHGLDPAHGQLVPAGPLRFVISALLAVAIAWGAANGFWL